MAPAHAQCCAGDRNWFWIRSCFLTHLLRKKNLAISLWFRHEIEADLLQMSARPAGSTSSTLKISQRVVIYAENIPAGGQRNHVYSSGILKCPGVCRCPVTVRQPWFQRQPLLMYLKPSLLFCYFLFGNCKEMKKKKRTKVFNSRFCTLSV